MPSLCQRDSEPGPLMVTVTQRPPGCIKVSSLACSPVLLYAAGCGCCFQTEVQVAKCICIQVLLLLLLLQAAAAQAFCCCCSDRLPLLLLRGWAWQHAEMHWPLIGGHLLLLQVLLHAAASASGISVTSVARRRAAHVGPANHSQDCMPGRAPAALTVTRRSQCLNLKIQVVLLLRLLLLVPAAACSMHLHSAHSAQSRLCGH